MSQAYKSYSAQTASGCQDRYETKQVGLAKKGFPVWEKMTMFGPDGAGSFSSINEVVEFSHATLDASLFDVPKGYREVKESRALSVPRLLQRPNACESAEHHTCHK